ncbi:DUF6683 family protein [Calidithermus timidus]|jgi:hypothetical protein|uniref:DUF6683 family protein n=1 Tax=Calidithermus timidus TaxID=307124 RepID=UPI0003A894C6|nr:DUF6683 family protein [Calidithermus timidus]
MGRNILALLVFLLLCAAQAQYIAGGWGAPVQSFSNIYQANVYMAYNNLMLASQMAANKAILQAVIKRSQQKQGGSAQTATPRTTFRPGPKRLLVQAFAQSLTQNKAQQAELVKVFELGLELYEDEARRAGKPNDVAMAFTYFVGVCYFVYAGEEPSEQALLGLWGAVEEAFASSLEFKKATDPERQRLYELFVLMATLPLAGYSVATEANDAALKKTYQEIAGVALEAALGVRPDRLKFAPTGLELR